MARADGALSTGIATTLFQDVDEDERFEALVQDARGLDSAGGLRGLVASCAGVGNESRSVGILRPAVRSLKHLGVLSSAQAPVVMAEMLGRATLGRRSRKTLAVMLTYNQVRRDVGVRLSRRQLIAISDALGRIFSIDDVVDDRGFMDDIGRASDPAAEARRRLGELEDVRALGAFLPRWRFAGEAPRAATEQLAETVADNIVRTLALLATLTDHDSRIALDAVLGISAGLAQLVACLCLAGVEWDPGDTTGAAARTLRDAAGLAVVLQCLDDFLDCVSDGPIYRGTTGVNAFRCVVHERDADALIRIGELSRFDGVALARAFPADVVRYFTALGKIELSPATAAAARDSLLLFELKDLL